MTALRIAFFGDSFTNGTGDPAMLGWVGRLCAAAATRGHDITCYNLGVRRHTSRDIQARWHRETTARLPENSALIFSYGANDCVIEDGAQRIPQDETLAITRAILTTARTIAPTLMIGPLPIADDPDANHRIASLDAALASVCATLATPYLPVLAAIQSIPAWTAEALAGDGAHPASAGYAALATLIDAWPEWRRLLP